MKERLKAIDRDAWRDAARAALQGAGAAAATYVVMRQMDLPEVFIGILSAVFILQPSIGGTVKSAGSRLAATLVGTAAGLTTLLALPHGVSTALALAISVFLVGGIASIRSEWSYGLVAAVGVSLASEQDPLQTALDRATAIALGAGIGLGASLVVWPERSRTRRQKHFHRAVRAVRDRVDDAVATAAGQGQARAKEIAPHYYQEMALAREADRYSRLRGGGDNDRLAALRGLYNATIVIDRADDALAARRSLIHDLKKPVQEIRSALVEALDRILDGDPDPREPLTRIDRTLASLTSRSVDLERDAGDARARLALSFGLAELRTSLCRLLDALEEARP